MSKRNLQDRYAGDQTWDLLVAGKEFWYLKNEAIYLKSSFYLFNDTILSDTTTAPKTGEFFLNIIAF